MIDWSAWPGMIQAGTLHGSPSHNAARRRLRFRSPAAAQSPGSRVRRFPTTLSRAAWAIPAASRYWRTGRPRSSGRAERRSPAIPARHRQRADPAELLDPVDLFGLCGGFRDQPCLERLSPGNLEVARHAVAFPVVAHDLQRCKIGLAQEQRQDLVRRLPLYSGAISGCWIGAVPSKASRRSTIPGKWASGNMPVAELGGLVIVEPEVDPQLDLVCWQKAGEIEIGRCIIGRVAAENDKRVDGAGGDRPGELAERAGLVRRARVGPRGKTRRSCRYCPGRD